MLTKHALELWPKVRPFACCKCPAYFESTVASSYVAVCQKGGGWDIGTDVDGRSVIYCPTHAMPRIEWAEEMAYVRADDLLEPMTENVALAKYVIERCNAEYSARIVAPGFDLIFLLDSSGSCGGHSGGQRDAYDNADGKSST